MALGISNKVVLTERSNSTPAIAEFGGKTIVAWRAEGGQEIVLGEFDGTTVVKNKQTTNEKASSGPYLSVVGGRLKIAWNGVDAQHDLNVADVTF